MATPYISMAGIGKSFGPVHALKSVNLTVYPGEIHALLGENGAGKSTLMKVLSGIHEPTKGTITINNINYNKLDHKLAAQLGIGIIYQELSVIDELTVLENFIYWSSSDEKNLRCQYYRLARNACPRRNDVITRGLES
ncbi:D-allose ABC transporter, ATPase component [Escherichia coli ISC41]|nr:D-allose ABC transporter, ATPase component [Escherichia coli ISC41]